MKKIKVLFTLLLIVGCSIILKSTYNVFAEEITIPSVPHATCIDFDIGTYNGNQLQITDYVGEYEYQANSFWADKISLKMTRNAGYVGSMIVASRMEYIINENETVIYHKEDSKASTGNIQYNYTGRMMDTPNLCYTIFSSNGTLGNIQNWVVNGYFLYGE